MATAQLTVQGQLSAPALRRSSPKDTSTQPVTAWLALPQAGSLDRHQMAFLTPLVGKVSSLERTPLLPRADLVTIPSRFHALTQVGRVDLDPAVLLEPAINLDPAVPLDPVLGSGMKRALEPVHVVQSKSVVQSRPVAKSMLVQTKSVPVVKLEPV